jgi:gluconolactonase
MHKNVVLMFCCLLLTHCKNEKKVEESSMEEKDLAVLATYDQGSIAAYDDLLWSIIPKQNKMKIIAEGHDWTEGPLWIEGEQMLLYSDIPRNAIYAWKSGEGVSEYLKPSGFSADGFQGSEPGANGLLLDQEGSLVLCQHGNRQMAKMDASLLAPSANFLALASTYNGKRFNSPNDAVYKSNGDLYFTDPPYGLPEQMDDKEKEISFQGVYRLNKNGEVQLLTKEFTRPNGIAFSPDEKTLYIANSDPKQAHWKAFTTTVDGKLENGRVFYDATDLVPYEKGLPDGMKVDDKGNIFATGPGGVFVFSSSGQLLGKILTQQATSNCAFNSDKTMLYITADSYVLQLELR